MLAGVARSENPCGAHGNSRPERPNRRRFSCEAQEGEGSVLSGTAGSSAARVGEAPDERLRVDDHFRNRLTEEREQNVETGACLLAWRIAGRSGNLDLASCHDDPRSARRKGTKSNWD